MEIELNNNIQKVVRYEKLGKIRLKTGLFRSPRDPSVDLEREILDFINSQKKKYNQIVSDSFDIQDDDYTKFEFFDVSPRAQKISLHDDKIDNRPVAFRSNVGVTLLYLKQRSVIIFQTKYSFVICAPGCGSNGALQYTGGTNYELEEIYFNKITTVGAQHSEETFNVLNEGCFSGAEAMFVDEKDGFIIRAGEAFRIFAAQKYSQELRDARSLINSKISDTN